MKIRLGTRGSHLARTQSSTIAAELEKLGHETELVIIKTAGDRSDAPSFGAIGPQGVFVREIEQALLADTVDVAVHSFKDLPTDSPDELLIGAVPARFDPADILVMRNEVATTDAAPLPITMGAKVGTASARRQAWIKHLRPDLVVEPTRGNVPTRIGRLQEGFDAVVLAAAGLERLQTTMLEDAPELALDDVVVARLDPAVFVPAPAQGALAVQCREADSVVREALAGLDDPETRRCVFAERTLLARIEGGCDLAFGAYAAKGTEVEGGFRLTALLEHEGELKKGKARGVDALALVDTVWKQLR